ncbi:helix-turn-helix domain-containing protein [Streptomyces armeniacus]|uniref:Helix-turn-helix domain-containing protein n=1 Tax=Streptomyces armeniacus TaxID=83291 RepID=A0A345XZJ2_9ACTN|nr:helix-turn-helix domain-containing protein [Streptomyces armeniacus]
MTVRPPSRSRASSASSWYWWARSRKVVGSAARVLLGDQPVTRVAHLVGYAGPSAFVEAFRKEYGHTPGRHADRAGYISPVSPADTSRASERAYRERADSTL